MRNRLPYSPGIETLKMALWHNAVNVIENEPKHIIYKEQEQKLQETKPLIHSTNTFKDYTKRTGHSNKSQLRLDLTNPVLVIILLANVKSV